MFPLLIVHDGHETDDKDDAYHETVEKGDGYRPPGATAPSAQSAYQLARRREYEDQGPKAREPKSTKSKKFRKMSIRKQSSHSRQHAAGVATGGSLSHFLPVTTRGSRGEHTFS